MGLGLQRRVRGGLTLRSRQGTVQRKDRFSDYKKHEHRLDPFKGGLPCERMAGMALFRQFDKDNGTIQFTYAGEPITPKMKLTTPYNCWRVSARPWKRLTKRSGTQGTVWKHGVS